MTYAAVLAVDNQDLSLRPGMTATAEIRDDLIVMPLRTVQRRLLGNADVATIFVSAQPGRPTRSVQAQTEALLRQRRKLGAGRDSDFTVRNMQELAEAMSSATGTLTALLGAIGAVSLLVGGIDIMNIMLVNVTEPIRSARPCALSCPGSNRYRFSFSFSDRPAKVHRTAMDEGRVEIRTELAASPRTRVEIGQDGVLHVLAGPVTLHLDRAVCEELTTTLARAMVVLARTARRRPAPTLRLVRQASAEPDRDEP